MHRPSAGSSRAIEAAGKRSLLVAIGRRRPELGDDLVTIDERPAHTDAGRALFVLLLADVACHLLPSHNRFIGWVPDIDHVATEQVYEAGQVPFLPGLSVALDANALALSR